MKSSPFHKKTYPQAINNKEFKCKKFKLSDYGEKFLFAFLKHCVEIAQNYELSKKDFFVLREIIDKIIDGIYKSPCNCLVSKNLYLKDTIISENLKKLLDSTKLLKIDSCYTELDKSTYITLDLLLKKIGVKVDNFYQ